jgi:structural maintenance of chromosomes protein 6
MASHITHLSLFGQVDRYKREKKFRGDVTGPIGCYIKVASGMNEFAAIAEHSLGGNMLDRFVVTNDHDNSLFREIRKQAGCVQDCGMFQVHPSSRYQIPGTLGIEGIERVSSVFVIENDLVFNCLIDNARMEQKAVAQDRIYSQEKLLMKDGGRDSIRGNIKDVYLPRGDYWTVRSGSLAMFSNENALKQTIGVDRSAAIADAQSEELSLRNDLHSVHGEYSKLDNDHSRYQREWNQAKRAMQQNSADINNLTEKIETIKDDMKASVNQTIDTTELEEDVQQAEDLLANHKAMEQKYLADKEELLPNINEAKNRLKECSIRNTKVLEDITAAEQELTQFLETQTQQNDKIEKKRQKLQKYRDDFDTLQRQIDLISSRRADYLRKARTMHFRCQQRQLPMTSPDQEEIHPEIQLEPTLEDLEAIEPLNVKHESTWYELRLQKTEERIRNEKERRNVSSEDAAIVYERYSRAKADLAAKTDEVAETDSRIEELEKDVVLRRKRWRQFRKHLARSTGLKFDEMLTMNKYTGNLEFDDVNGTLGLSVQKNTSDSHSESKDVKALR